MLAKDDYDLSNLVEKVKQMKVKQIQLKANKLNIDIPLESFMEDAKSNLSAKTDKTAKTAASTTITISPNPYY